MQNQPDTWHRGAPPSHRLKHDSRAIVSALVLDGDFAQQAQGPEEEEEENGGDGR